MFDRLCSESDSFNRVDLKQKGLAFASPSKLTPSTFLGHRNWLCILPTILAEILFEIEQTRVKFAKRRNVCVIAFAIEEVEHGGHLFFRSTASIAGWSGESHRAANDFGEGLCDLRFSQF